MAGLDAAYQSLSVEWPPGGAWSRVVERSVSTLPVFWLAPFAKALDPWRVFAPKARGGAGAAGASVSKASTRGRGTGAAGTGAARAAGASITDIDSRAQAGDVTFEDFLKVGRTFRQMKGNMPGMPGQLTQKQIDDTLEKFDLHEKIVEAMSPDEKGDPQLVLDDLKNTENQLPRIQRIAKASGCAEKDVALFCAEFEAMRQSTQRIAAGEDPDEVNADIGSSNRAQRRAAKKAQKKRR
mmetsp:Transcript_33199/g.107844  ORF Transcript_33199/g.107844 Transcript_33199/m.107844 type:complete len:239 (-) Transcript_33199:44-760(-)